MIPHTRSTRIPACSVLLSLTALMLCPVLQAQKSNPEKTSVTPTHDILYVSKSNDGNRTIARLPGDDGDGEQVHRFKNPRKTIQKALKTARITVIMEGEYTLKKGIRITRDGRRLITAPGASLTLHQGGLAKMINIYRANDVRIFHFGSIDLVDKGYAVWFHGIKGGQTGIYGGMLFATGDIKNANAGYWLIDTSNVSIPLVWGEGYGNTLVAMEGNHDIQIGTLAGLGGKWENETIDFNAMDSRVQISTVIGTAPKKGDEIIDANSTQYVTIGRFITLMSVGQKGKKLVNWGPVNKTGMFSKRVSKRANARKTRGNQIFETTEITKDVAQFKREVQLPGFPGRLPELKIKAKLVVKFEDGSTKVLHDQAYQFDL